MEQERQAREQEEKDRVERMKKIKDQFADPNNQWEKDKTDIQNEAMKEKKAKEDAEAGTEKPAAGPESSAKPETPVGALAEAKVEDITTVKNKPAA